MMFDSHEHLDIGRRFFCKHCQSDSVVKLVRRMDGWHSSEVFGACALCGKKVCEAGVPRPDSAVNEGTVEKAGQLPDQVAQLFGDVSDENKSSAANVLGETETRFCRDCRFFFVNPFQCRCLRRQQAVEPMGNCNEFERKKPDCSEEDYSNGKKHET